MKLSKKYAYFLALLALPVLVVMCMTIDAVRVITDDPQVGEELVIEVDISHVAETDGKSGLVFGILAPRLWDIANTATVTLSTTAGSPANVYNGELKVISSTAENPSDGLTWPASFQSRFGILNNLGPVEWVVFETPNFQFDIDDNDADKKTVTGTVRISFVPNTAIKCFMGFTFAGREYGYDGQKYKENIYSREITVEDGEEDILDYVNLPRVVYLPTTFGYGDIFSIRYNEFVDEYELRGGDVYLWAEAEYTLNGAVQTKTVDVRSDKTVMELIQDDEEVTTWMKYIYPPEFFDLPQGAVILGMKIHFTNKDKSITVINEDRGVDFNVSANCE